MAMKEKTDYFHMLDEGGEFEGSAALLSSSESRSASVVTAKDERGDVVASQVFGEKISPACEYVLTNEKVIAFSLGGGWMTAADERPVAITSITISTAAGAAPKISVSGETVKEEIVWVTAPETTVSPRHHAQILFDAFALGGERNYLTAANYTFSGTLSTVTKDGEVLTAELMECKIEASVTIRQVGSAKPVLTPGEGWEVQSPLTVVENDADPYPTWTAKLVKYVAKDAD